MDKSAPSLDTLFTKLLFTIVFDPILAFPLQLSLITNYLFNISNETYCYMHGSTPLPHPPQKKNFHLFTICSNLRLQWSKVFIIGQILSNSYATICSSSDYINLSSAMWILFCRSGNSFDVPPPPVALLILPLFANNLCLQYEIEIIGE